MAESFAELFEQSMANIVMRAGAVVVGEVVDVTDDYVIVSAGLKSEAEIPAAEFRNAEGELTVKVGDEVEVAIEAVEDGLGCTKLSRERAMRARAWDDL